MPARVEIFTTSWCPYCVSAKKLLASKGVAFVETDVQDDAAKRKWLVETTGQKTVPQIFADGKALGGFSDISDLDSKGELDRILGL